MRTLSLALTLSLTLLAAAPALAQTAVVVDREATVGALQAVGRELTALQTQATDPNLSAALTRARDALRAVELQMEGAQPAGAITVGMPVPQPTTIVMPQIQMRPLFPVGAIAPMPQPAPPPPPPAGPQPMEEGAFAGLLKAIEGESFENQRLVLLRSASASQLFVIAQVSRLLALFSFDSNKLAVVRMLRRRILDKQDAYKLAESFPFSSSKTKMLQMLR